VVEYLAWGFGVGAGIWALRAYHRFATKNLVLKADGSRYNDGDV